jgi:hypothetical protein
MNILYQEEKCRAEIHQNSFEKLEQIFLLKRVVSFSKVTSLLPYCNKLGCLQASAIHFHPGLIFVGQPEAYQSAAPYRTTI